jgi:hypothetical protein
MKSLRLTDINKDEEIKSTRVDKSITDPDTRGNVIKKFTAVSYEFP